MLTGLTTPVLPIAARLAGSGKTWRGLSAQAKSNVTRFGAAARGGGRHLGLYSLPAGNQSLSIEHRHVIDADRDLLRRRPVVGERRQRQAQGHILRPIQRQIEIGRLVGGPDAGGAVRLLGSA